MICFLRSLPASQLLFLAALAIYAFFGSPTPDGFGLAEICVFAMMVLAVAPRFDAIRAPEAGLLIYSLTFPLWAALQNSAGLNEILRDIVPFLFLLIPVFYAYQTRDETRLLTGITVFIGLVFSMRSLASFGANIFHPDEWLGTPPNLLYLANSPEVLFAALVLLGAGAVKNSSGIKILGLTCAVFPLLAMATLMQRASLFYILGASVCALGVLFWTHPRKGLFMVVIAASLFAIASPFIDEIFRQLSFKTQMVGLNSRGAEWAAVLTRISNTPFDFMFGLGWGAQFENPAVGGLRVNFTHSLLSSLFLKTGLLGVSLFLLYAAQLVREAMPRLIARPLYLYALAGPLLIGLGLYASYKSLGYGLLLLILASLAQSGKKLDGGEAPVS